MPLAIAARTRLASAFVGTPSGFPCTHLSLHSNNPGEDGDYEISGGSPAYARASARMLVTEDYLYLESPVTFQVPASTTVAYVGMWSAIELGQFLGYGSLAGSTVSGIAVAVNNIVYAAAHQLLDGDTVYVAPYTGNLPAPLEQLLYKVTVIDANTFTLRDAVTDAPITITEDAAFTWQRVVPTTYTVQGVQTVSNLILQIQP